MESWRSHKLRLERSSDGRFRWWLDLLLLDTLVRDCIESRGTELTLWRIHRRATDDVAGHEFAFISYAPEDVHRALDVLIAGHAALRFLQNAGLLRELISSDDGSAIAATSAPTWPEPLKRAWPYYIDGVSRMALKLVDELRASPRPALDAFSAADCEAYYSKLMAQFNEVWHDWGSDAFLHHINAVFGYQPVVARPRSVDGMLAVF